MLFGVLLGKDSEVEYFGMGGLDRFGFVENADARGEVEVVYVRVLRSRRRDTLARNLNLSIHPGTMRFGGTKRREGRRCEA